MKRLKTELNALVNRGVDRHLRLAVTGLSRSGKTAFITAMVNQLLNVHAGARLPLLSAVREERLLGVKRVPQRDFGIPRFTYDEGILQLYGNPPAWPTPTRGVSEIRLALRYRSNDSLLRHFKDTSTLYLEIVDYPGEWLLDLPMLAQDYLSWSRQMNGLLQGQRAEWAAKWRQLCDGLDPLAPADENRLAEIAAAWTDYLHQCKSQGLHFIQPGRFVLPGDMAGAPALQFFPWPDVDAFGESKLAQADKQTNAGMLRERFNYYCEKVVKGFYKNHFLRFDRQIVNVPDAVFAWLLDGRGGVKPLEDNDVIDSQHPCWLHLNYTHPDSARWLASTPLLPNNVRDALAGESSRPRVSRMGEGTLITLRCINGSTDERPDQLVAMRLYMDERFIVSTRQRKVLALDDVVSDLQEGTGPVDCGGWLVDVCDALTDHASEFIEELHDKIIDLEDNLLDQQIPPRGFLALLRKQLIVMRRYMAPQRDVYARLASERLPWMSDDHRRRMQDIADRLGRGLDEIDACIARTGIMADEIAQVMQESLARRTYTMSLMAMVFLPSTFLTGLFGVNLGGIPGGGWRFGFSLFCILLVVLIGGVTLWLHRSKWL